MTNLIMHPELLDGKSGVGQETRIPFIEFYNDNCGVDHVENMKNLPSPRLIKTHLPEQLFPSQAFDKKSKIIYIARNPKDNAVSMYYFYQSTACYGYYKESWDQFVDMYMNGHIVYGSWFDHVMGWWKHSHQPNVLFLKYEDVKKNFRGTIEQIASFLGRDLNSATIDRIMDYCSFENMKKNPAVNRMNAADVDSTVSPFMRKGIVGDWKNHFTVAQNEQFERLYYERLENSGLEFEW
ncbi:sulfotransferase 1A1-like [Glandiceps talaboti]